MSRYEFFSKVVPEVFSDSEMLHENEEYRIECPGAELHENYTPLEARITYRFGNITLRCPHKECSEVRHAVVEHLRSACDSAAGLKIEQVVKGTAVLIAKKLSRVRREPVLHGMDEQIINTDGGND
jgi:hypothetical protein